MLKPTPGLLAAVLTILFAGTSAAVWITSSARVENLEMQKDTIIHDAQKVRRATSEGGWEGVFFGIIKEHTMKAKIPDLSTVLPPEGGFEIRVWVGFGINGEDSFILRHSSNQWSAAHLHGMSEHPPFVITLRTLDAPQSGWEATWQRLTESGILTLPDASAVGCNTQIFDGRSYVVEINKDKTYRTYLYDNPKHAPCSEAKQILEIGEIIAEEFGLSGFKSSN